MTDRECWKEGKGPKGTDVRMVRFSYRILPFLSFTSLLSMDFDAYATCEESCRLENHIINLMFTATTRTT